MASTVSRRDILEAQREARRKRDQKPQDQQAPQAPGRTIAPPTVPSGVRSVGGFGVRPMGPTQPGGPSGTERDIKLALGALKTAAKPAGQLFDALNQPNLGTFDRGAAEQAYQAQRAGERADFTSPMAPLNPAAFGAPNVGTAEVPLFNPSSAAGTDPTAGLYGPGSITSGGVSTMPSSAGELGITGPGSIEAPGGATGGFGVGAPGGWTGGASQIGSTLGAGLGTALSAYNLAQAIQAGNPAGIATGALGTATGAGATAAAAGSQTAGAIMGAVAAPLAVAAPVIMAVMAYLSEDDRKNMVEKLRQVNMRNSASAYEGGVNQAQSTADAVRDVVSGLSPQGQQLFMNTAEHLLTPSDQQSSKAMSPVPFSPLESIGMLRRSDVPDNQTLGTAAGKPFTELYKDLAYVMSQNPNLSIPSFAPEKTRDINSDIASLHGEGGAAKPGDYQGYYNLLPGLPPGMVQQLEATGQEGNPYTISYVPNPELGGQFSPEVLQSPFYAQEYWQSKGVTPQEAMLYGLGQNVNNAQADLAPHWQGQYGLETVTPEQLAQYYTPGALYNYLTTQGGLSPVQAPVAGPSAAPAAAPVAEQSGEAGKAVGRLQPANPLTGTVGLPRPEAEARTEAVFGKLQPTAGKPFGGGPAAAPSAPTPPPVPGTSQAEAPAFATRPGGGLNIQPGGNIGTAGLRVAMPFGWGVGSPGPFGQGSQSSRGNV